MGDVVRVICVQCRDAGHNGIVVEAREGEDHPVFLAAIADHRLILSHTDLFLERETEDTDE